MTKDRYLYGTVKQHKATLGKSERLKSRKTIALLFDQGQKIRQAPIQCLWLVDNNNGPSATQFAFSVPKRKFKRATDRNAIKRRMREAWRIHKSNLENDLSSQDKQVVGMLIYAASHILTFQEIEQKIILILQRLREGL